MDGSAALPRELWLWAFDFLPATDACNAQLVCRTFREVGADNISWKERVTREFGPSALGDTPSWYDLYKLLRRWTWAESDCANGPELDSTRLVATSRGAQGKEAAMSNQHIPLDDTIDRCFEITVQEPGQLFAVGLADAHFPEMLIYSWKNNGSGWYSSGGAWSDSTGMWSGKTYGKGDKVVMHVNMKKRTLQYYLNKVPVEKALDLKFVLQPLHAVVLLGNGSQAKLRYASSLDTFIGASSPPTERFSPAPPASPIFEEKTYY